MRRPRTTTKSSPGSLQLEKARMQQQRPNTAKNNKYINKFIFKKKKRPEAGIGVIMVKGVDEQYTPSRSMLRLDGISNKDLTKFQCGFPPMVQKESKELSRRLD